MRNSCKKQYSMWYIALQFLFLATLGCDSSPTGRWSPEDFFDDADVIVLVRSANSGDLEKLDELVGKGVDVNKTGKDNMTPLLFSMWAKNKKGFKRLLEHGADPNIQIDDGDSVTSLSALSVDDSDWLKMVLEHGADVDLVDTRDDIEFFRNRTPIFSAVRSGNITNLRMLIDAGADLDHQDASGSTAAMIAAGRRWYIAVWELLESDADCRLVDEHGHDLAFYSLDYSVDSTQFPETSRYREKVIALLRKRGIDIEAMKRRVAEHNRIPD